LPFPVTAHELLCALFHCRNYKHQVQVLHAALDKFADIPRDHDRERKVVLKQLTQFWEEGPDPYLPATDNPVDVDLLAKATERSKELYGIQDAFTIRLWMLRIFHSSDRRKECLGFLKAGIELEMLAKLFNTGEEALSALVETTDNFGEGSMGLDRLKAIRYFYVLALVFSHMGRDGRIEANAVYESATHIALNTYNVPAPQSGIRSSRRLTELILLHVELLLKTAELKQELGRPNSPLSLLSQVQCDEATICFVGLHLNDHPFCDRLS